jgi:hypothetical protein
MTFLHPSGSGFLQEIVISRAWENGDHQYTSRSAINALCRVEEQASYCAKQYCTASSRTVSRLRLGLKPRHPPLTAPARAPPTKQI